MKKALGLDLGVASVGWSLMEMDDDFEFKRIIDLNSHTFSEITNKGKLENLDRREKRGSRRILRRRNLRLKLCKNFIERRLEIDCSNLSLQKSNNEPYPYNIKVKGLTELLSKEELAVILIHYVKYRGFKSNRKSVDEKSSENGKLIKYLGEVSKTISDNNLTISQYLIDQFKNKNRIHNTSEEYLFTATRQMYLDEINKVLDKQIEFGLIDNDFKEEYIKIFSRQRDFSEGPGAGSPFGAKNGKSLIELRVGTCEFDGQPRAPKTSFSAESFVLLSFLNNLQYRNTLFDNYKGLTAEEIKKVYNYALGNKKLSYKIIFKLLNIEVKQIKGVSLSNKSRKKYLSEYKIKNGISENTPLPIELYDSFNAYAFEKLISEQKIPELSNYHTQLKLFENAKKDMPEISSLIDDFINDKNNFDFINTIMLYNKTDDAIAKVLKDKCDSRIIQLILCLDDVKETINLSINLCKKLNDKLLLGMTYDKAMLELNYDHSSKHNIEVCEYLPPIDECMNGLNEHLTNPVVRHTLVEARKIVNAIIKKYGKPDRINIELAREICLGKKANDEITNIQNENRDRNIVDRIEIINKYPNQFIDTSRITRDDIIKYRLFKEQKGLCAYSGEIIEENKLFDNNLYQIDHIIPYSRSFEDGMFNKVLVTAKANQEKKNRTPYEAFYGTDSWNIILNVMIKNPNISEKKKETLLSKESDYSEWLERNLNDTKYISKLFRKIIMQYLGYDNNTCIATNGKITDLMKGAYGLKGKTHSFATNDSEYNEKHIIMLKDNIIISDKDITLNYYDKFNNQEYSKKYSYVSPKEKTNKDGTKTTIELSKKVKDINFAIKTINNNFELFKMFLFDGLESADLNQLLTKCTTHIMNSSSEEQSDFYKSISIILINLIEDSKEEILKKNRDNHLHHALDATLIACVTPKIIHRMNNFYKFKEGVTIDEVTGEELRYPNIDLPYKDFRREIIIRCYERNYDLLINNLKQLSNYKEIDDFSNIKVIQPTRFPEHYKKGPLTDETLMGIRNDSFIVKRVNISQLEVNTKNIEKIYDKDGGNKVVYESIKEWIKNNKATKYPIHRTKKNVIKSVLIIESSDVNKRVLVKSINQSYAANTDVVMIDVYKKDDSYYFVPIYYRQLCSKDVNQKYEIMWKNGDDGHEYLTKEFIDKKLNFQFRMPRYSLIEIETNNGKVLCYSGGCTSGLFEIYSILGDGYDLLNSNLFNNISDRYRPSISTIKSIKLHNISMLGNIS